MNIIKPPLAALYVLSNIPGPEIAVPRFLVSRLLHWYYVGCLHTFRALLNRELHLLSFF
jgi:hypothetical protein